MSFVMNWAVRFAFRPSSSLTVTFADVPVVGPGNVPVVQALPSLAVQVVVTPKSIENASEVAVVYPASEALNRYVLAAAIDRSSKVATPLDSARDVVPATVVAGSLTIATEPVAQVTADGFAPPLRTATVIFGPFGSNALFVMTVPGRVLFGCAVNASEQLLATVVRAGVGSGLIAGIELSVPRKSLDWRTSVFQSYTVLAAPHGIFAV